MSFVVPSVQFRYDSYLQPQLQFTPFKQNFRMLLQYIGFLFLSQVDFVEFRLHFWIHTEYKYIFASYMSYNFLSLHHSYFIVLRLIPDCIVNLNSSMKNSVQGQKLKLGFKHENVVSDCL